MPEQPATPEHEPTLEELAALGKLAVANDGRTEEYIKYLTRGAGTYLQDERWDVV